VVNLAISATSNSFSKFFTRLFKKCRLEFYQIVFKTVVNDGVKVFFVKDFIAQTSLSVCNRRILSKVKLMHNKSAAKDPVILHSNHLLKVT
jgi:hypothetical protein